MLRLMLEEKDLVDEFYEPRWGEGAESATLQNLPEGTLDVLALFTKVDEVDQAARDAVPAVPTAPDPIPDTWGRYDGRNSHPPRTGLRIVRSPWQ